MAKRFFERAACIFPKVPVVLLVLAGSVPAAQDSTQPAAAQSPGTVNVYVDFPDYRIDDDYVRTEIAYVNHMRDRADADVHVLVTTQRTGAGGREFTIAFIGLKQFEGQKGTLVYASAPAETDDTIRKELVRRFKIGLMPFVSRSPAVERLDVTYRTPAGSDSTGRKPPDPWNFWTFRMSFSGHGNGEKSYKYSSLYSTFSASRVTDAWKIAFNLNFNHTKTRYDYGEALSYTDLRSSHSGDGSVVKSLTPHWSLRIRANAFKSTYNNYDLSASAAPGIEYNVFPYSESTRRMFTFQYHLEANWYDYHEETVYLKMRERRFEQQMGVSLTAKQPWGSVGTSCYVGHDLADIGKYNANWYSNFDLRLFKGLSLDCYGYLTLLRNQLSLPRRGASLEEILLRRRELETSYYYYFSVGFSYTFGSIYNNVVNPRFGGY